VTGHDDLADVVQDVVEVVDKLLHRVHFVFADPDVVEQERIEGRD